MSTKTTTVRPTTVVSQDYKEGFRDALENILVQMEDVRFYKPRLVEEHLRGWIQRHIPGT
ncbi:MAG: hypothetical protein Q6354_09570 [Candidatus Brocadiales bacterium]|nr:hypothetical protein [Candidatus Brocadiales bacterium]